MDAPPTRAPGRARSARPTRGPTAALRISLLGGFSVSGDGVGFELPKGARRLVALVALHRRGISRARAALLLAPHLEPTTANGSLRATLARLRATAPAILAADATTLRLAPDVHVDAWELETLAARLADESEPPPEAVNLESLTLELLPGWEDDWVLLERTRLEELFLHALEAQARRLLDSGCLVPALAMAYHVLRVDPLRETATRLLIEIQLHEGNQAQATRSYLDFRERLRQALGVEPSERVRALIAPLLSGRTAR